MINAVFTWLTTIDSLKAADLFIYAILFLFSLAIFAIYRNKIKEFAEYAPALLTTLGILGTFLGITIGLSRFEFDSHQAIDKSIPHLLVGLKMAFITSIFGMGCSIIVKSYLSWKKNNNNIPETITPELFYQIFLEQHKSLELVRKALSGEDESNVVTQLQKLRTDLNDCVKDIQKDIGVKLDVLNKKISETDDSSIIDELKTVQNVMNENSEKIRTEFKDFSNMLSEMATKNLIEALNNVIKDFNKNLTEQFGDNFKNLNSAVEKLVQWQEEYKQQMIDLKSSLDTSSAALQSGSTSISNIQKSTEVIPQYLDQLNIILNTLGTELKTLEHDLTAFSEIRDNAVKALPAISDNVETITSMVKQTVEQGSAIHSKFVVETTEMVDWVTAKLKDTANDISDKNTELVDMLSKSSENMSNTVTKVIQDMEANSSKLKEEGVKMIQAIGHDFKASSEKAFSSMDSLYQKNTDKIEDVCDKLAQSSEKIFQNLNAETAKLTMALREESQKAAAERAKIIENEISSQIKALDDALQEELTRSMQIMANKLASITDKFVSDYEKYFDSLSKINEQR